MQLLRSSVKLGQDHKDVTLQQLMDNGNWKQALSNIDRKLTKGHDDRLLVNRIIVLKTSKDQSKVLQATQELNALLSRSSPITDIEILRALDGLATSEQAKDLLTSKWEQAQTAHVQNEKFYTEWIKSALSRIDVEGAQKAAAKGMSISKQKRRFFLQTVVYSHILATMFDFFVSENTRKLHESLAIKYLSAAASRIVPDDNFVASFMQLTLSKKQALQTKHASTPIDVSSIALQTPRDLQFLIYVFRRQGQVEAALSILKDHKRTGLRSAIAAGSWPLLGDFLKILEACKKWDEVWKICHDLLSDASRARSGQDERPVYSYGSIGDDFNIWKTLVRAAIEIGSVEAMSKTRTALHDSDGLNLRSRILARLELELHHQSQTSGHESLRATLCEYLNRFGDSPSLFKDLSYYAPRIPADLRKDLIFELQKIVRETIPGIDGSSDAKVKWLRSETNLLKLQYNLIVSYTENLPNIDLLESFATSCLELYRLSLSLEPNLPSTERRCGDDAAVLAAMTFVHLAHLRNDSGLLQSAIILECLLLRSPHNYDALLLLVRIYIHKGATSRAFDTYEKLGIKNIQGFTLSWLLVTRLSTLHPRFSKTKRCDPQVLISENCQWLDEKVQAQSRFHQRYIDNDNAIGFCEMFRLIYMLDKSCSLQIFHHESIRIERCGGTSPAKESLKGHDWGFSYDVRDSSAVPSYEHCKQPTLDQYIRPGPIPSKRWVDTQSCLSVLNRVMGRSEDLDYILEHFDKSKFSNLFSKCVNPRDPSTTELDSDNAEVVMELTRTERQTLRTIRSMINALMEMASLHEDLRGQSATDIPDVCPYANRLKQVETMVSKGVSAMSDYLTNPMDMKEISKDPLVLAGNIDWQFFHDYYVKIDLSELYLRFLNVVAEFRRTVMRHFVEHPTFQPMKSGFDNAIALCEDVKHFNVQVGAKGGDSGTVAVALRELYRKGDRIDEMTDSVLGRTGGGANIISDGLKSALVALLDEDFVKACCREIAGSLVDCLEGVIIDATAIARRHASR